jgi:hypothetical protein
MIFKMKLIKQGLNKNFIDFTINSGQPIHEGRRYKRI